MHTRRLLQSSTLYLISNLASRAVGFVMIPLYSRYLLPAEYGLVELIELTIQIMALCIGLQSIGGAMIRIYFESADEKWRSGVVSSALLGGAAGNAVLALIGILAADPICRYILHAPGSESLVRLSAVAMMLSNVAEVNLVYLRLRDRVEQCVIYSLAQLLVAVSLNTYFIAYLRLGVYGFVISKLITASASCLFLSYRSLRDVGINWNSQAARRMSTFGGPLVISSLAFFVIHFGDRWFLSGLRTMTDVGNYSLAYRFAFIVTLLVGEPFGKVWNVNLYNFTSQPNWRAELARVARYLTFSLCFVGLGLSIFGSEIITRMATPAYRAAAAVVPILVVAYVGREVGDFFRNVLYINKQSGLVGRIALVSAIVNTLLNATLISRWGMFGAAWATLITWFLYMGLCWLAAVREHAIPFLARPFALALGSGWVLYTATTMIPSMHPALRLSLQLIFLVQFIIVLWTLDYFPPQEQTFIKNKLQVIRAGLSMWMRQRVFD